MPHRAEDKENALERLVKLESKYDFVVKAVTDHLERWDRQWTKIDLLSEKATVLEIESKKLGEIDKLIKTVDRLETEKRIWSNVISPIIGLVSGVLSCVLTLLIKEYFFK